jgi:hypothetical protein
MAKAIKRDLAFDIYDVDSAFLCSQPKGTTYIHMPPGRDKPGKVGLLLRNLYGSVWAPKLFSTRLYNSHWANSDWSDPNWVDANSRYTGKFLKFGHGFERASSSGTRYACARAIHTHRFNST